MSDGRPVGDNGESGKVGPGGSRADEPAMEYVEPGLALPDSPWQEVWVVWRGGRAMAREVALLRQMVPGLGDRSISDVLEAAGGETKWLLGRFKDAYAVWDLRERARAQGIVVVCEVEPGADAGLLPRGNNLYGTVVVAPLDRLMAAVKSVYPWERAYIYKSDCSGAETLHLNGAGAELDTEPRGDGKHLLKGAVGGSVEARTAFLQRLSDALKREGIGYSFELYDDDDVLLTTVSG